MNKVCSPTRTAIMTSRWVVFKSRRTTCNYHALVGLTVFAMLLNAAYVCHVVHGVLSISGKRYPHRMGMQVPFCGGMPQGLNLNETLMPQYLAKVGYSAHAVGKWHLGFTSWQHCPTFRGFESFYGYYNCAEDYFTHSVPGRNATYGLDFHDDPTPNCGPNCSRPAWEAACVKMLIV